MNRKNDIPAILKITKIEKQAVILMQSDEVELEKITLFISEYSPFHSGPETVEELLNHGPSFIPVKFSDGRFRILNRNKIIYVRETKRLDKQSDRDLLFYFEGGFTLKAAIFEPLPEHYGRTIDFLNSGRTFLPVLNNSFRIYINKNRVIKVEEL